MFLWPTLPLSTHCTHSSLCETKVGSHCTRPTQRHLDKVRGLWAEPLINTFSLASLWRFSFVFLLCSLFLPFFLFQLSFSLFPFSLMGFCFLGRFFSFSLSLFFIFPYSLHCLFFGQTVTHSCESPSWSVSRTQWGLPFNQVNKKVPHTWPVLPHTNQTYPWMYS